MDNIEMDPFEGGEEDRFRDPEEEEGETSFSEYNNYGQDEFNATPSGSDVPNVSRDMSSVKRSILQDKKRFLKRVFDMTLQKKDGVESTKLLNDIELSNNELYYKDVKILVEKDGTYQYLDFPSTRHLVLDFKRQMGKAREEFNKKYVDDYRKSNSENLSYIVDETVEQLENYVDDAYENLRKKFEKLFSDESIVTREVLAAIGNDVLKQEGMTLEQKIEALEVERKHWLEKSEKYTGEKKIFLEKLSECLSLKQDLLCLKNGEDPVNDISYEILKNEIDTSDLSRFEKFREWVKKNFSVFSGVLIGLGGIVTAIVVGVRSSLKKVGKTVKSASQTLAKIAEKVGAIIGAIVGLVSNILGVTAKAISFLSRNLWLLALFLLGYLYERYHSKK